MSSCIVMVPGKRNMSRLAIFADSRGNMTPFRKFVELVIKSVLTGSRFSDIFVYYFYKTPVKYQEKSLLKLLDTQSGTVLTRELITKIKPSTRGMVYNDMNLHEPVPLQEALEKAEGAFAIIISDAGAARHEHDLHRVINTMAFLKGLKEYIDRIVWLNPLPEGYWKNSTVREIARYVPMFPMDKPGLNKGIDVLRGKLYTTERNL